MPVFQILLDLIMQELQARLLTNNPFALLYSPLIFSTSGKVSVCQFLVPRYTQWCYRKRLLQYCHTLESFFQRPDVFSSFSLFLHVNSINWLMLPTGIVCVPFIAMALIFLAPNTAPAPLLPAALVLEMIDAYLTKFSPAGPMQAISVSEPKSSKSNRCVSKGVHSPNVIRIPKLDVPIIDVYKNGGVRSSFNYNRVIPRLFDLCAEMSPHITVQGNNQSAGTL